jgi:hypothetical protein
MPKRRQDPRPFHHKLAKTFVRVRAERALEDDKELGQQAAEWLELVGYADAERGRRKKAAGNRNRRGKYKVQPGVLRNAVMRACEACGEQSPRLDDKKLWIEIKRAVAEDQRVTPRTVSNALGMKPAIKNCRDALRLLKK